MKGMDICYHQGNIDFQKAKQDGIEFIIPRDGWGTSSIDPKLVEYTQEAQAAGIKVPGVYHFMYAVNLTEAVSNAMQAAHNVQAAGLPKDTVIWCDLEYDTVDNAKKRGVTLTAQQQLQFAQAFCDYCLVNGYPTGIYLNRDYLVNIYGTDISDSYDIWLADLEGEPDYPCLYQQYDWHGKPTGCPTDVDLDRFIGSYTAGTARPKQKKEDKLKASTLLTQIHDVVANIPTVYEQGASWGAWNGSAFRLDCIIFIKCLVYWGWYYPSRTAAHGGARYDANTDWTEIAILNHCSNVSKNKFLSALPGEYLYMDGHGGFKIDEFVKDGKIYNVAECTWASSWGTPAKCIYSYVDDDGNRYNYKGGIWAGAWEAHGRLQGVEYDTSAGAIVRKTAEEVAQEVLQGLWGNGEDRKTRLAAAGYDYNTVQAIVEDLVKASSEISTDTFTESTKTFITPIQLAGFLPEISKGDTGEMVRLLQNCLRAAGYYEDTIDGSAGNNTDKAIRAFQMAAGLDVDGYFGKKSWTALLS